MSNVSNQNEVDEAPRQQRTYQDSSARIKVHKYSAYPNYAWDSMKESQTFNTVKPMDLNTPVYPDKVRFVCISDTHSKHRWMSYRIPDGDVLLHTGDFTRSAGHPKQIVDFNEFLGTLPHKHKIVIAGNHELTMDPTFLTEFIKRQYLKRCKIETTNVYSFMMGRRIWSMKELLTNCTYLEDSQTEVYGLKIYGSPGQAANYKYWGFSPRGFSLSRGQECLDKWDMIPEDTDVLLTHGPPLGHGDLRNGNYLWKNYHDGCVELLQTIQQRVHPKYHIFGHIHEDHGISRDGITTYVNAAICDRRSSAPVNPPIIFDLPLPQGQTKQEWDKVNGAGL